MPERKLASQELIELMHLALFLAKKTKGEVVTADCPPEVFGAMVAAMFEELCRDRRRS